MIQKYKKIILNKFFQNLSSFYLECNAKPDGCPKSYIENKLKIFLFFLFK